MGATSRIAAAAAALFLGLLVAAGPARAAWQVLQTPRLRVYFQPGYEPAALRTAEVAEQALDALAQRLGHAPETPVHVVISDGSDLANGFTDVTFYNRIVIFPVFPVGLGYSAGLSPRMEDWLKLVVTHEVVHAVHLDMAEGPTVGLRTLFGHVPLLATPNVLQPRSWLEGIATLEETQLVTGARGQDPLFDMYLRTQVLSGTWPPLDQTLGLYDLERFQPAGTVYLYGYAWFDFLARRYGPDAIQRIQKGFAALRYALPGEATRDVLNRSMGALWEEMRQDLEGQFRRQVRAVEAQGVTEPQRLPSSGWVVVTPRVSPDGAQVAYAAQGPLVEDIRLLEPATGRDRQLALAPSTVPGGLDWTPDGRRIVYAAVEVRGATRFADLFELEVATGRVRRLTRGLRAYAPAVSPDGRQVAFASRDGLSTRLLVMPLEGAAGPGARSGPPPRVVWEPPAGWQILSVAWRPGPYVAVSVWRPGGFADILLLAPAAERAAGRAGEPTGSRWRPVREVTADLAVDDRPAWSPDGRYLLFHSDRDGIYNLYAFEPATGRFYRLTNVLTGAFDPTVTPDGQAVIFSWYQADGYHLARLPWDRLRWEPVTVRPDPRAPPLVEVAAGRADARAPAATDGRGQPEGRGQAAGEGAPAGEGRRLALPEGWRLEAYRPWETLRPQFWVPVSEDDWAGPQLGLATAGQDVLQRHQYAVEAAVGLLSGEPRLYAGYLHSAGDGAGPFFLVEGESRPTVFGDGWYRVRQVRAAALFPFTSYTRFSSVQLDLAAREKVKRAGLGGEILPGQTPSSREWIGLILSTAWLRGDHARARVGQARLSLTSVVSQDGQLTPLTPWSSGVLQLGWRQFGPGRPGLRLQLAAGLSGEEFGREDPFDVGVAGPFQVRAYGRDTLTATAAAASFRLELENRLRTIQRGLGDAPLFADSLDGSLFAEATAGWDWVGQRLQPTSPPLAAAVGAELRLRLTLNYGTAQVAVRLGFAHGLSPRGEDRVYLAISAP